MDHVSDSFLETNVPLLVLIEAAKNGNEKEVKEYAQVFREHANKLIEVIIISNALLKGIYIYISQLIKTSLHPYCSLTVDLCQESLS